MGKQGLYQKLSIQQKLSPPQQILLMKMLQIPAIALEQRIKQEIEENPALDELTGYDDNGGEAEKMRMNSLMNWITAKVMNLI